MCTKGCCDLSMKLIFMKWLSLKANSMGQYFPCMENADHQNHNHTPKLNCLTHTLLP